MRRAIILVSCTALGACATSNGRGITPDTARAIIQEFHNAGCGGSFDLNTGFNLGQLGGGVNLALDINAECPVGDIPMTTLPDGRVVPLRELNRIIPQAPAPSR